jgi:hypothetical protein
MYHKLKLHCQQSILSRATSKKRKKRHHNDYNDSDDIKEEHWK